MNGEAIRFLSREIPEAERTRGMIEAGVRVVACRNSIERFGFEPTDLADGVTFVENGVAELVRLQNAGAACLRLP